MDTQPNMEVIFSFENLASHQLSSSEEKQLLVELMYDMLKVEDPNSLTLFLAQLVSDSDCTLLREKCADLLYKLLTDDMNRVWNHNLSPSTQATVKSILLIRINLEESSEYLMETLCFTVSKICNISKNNWPELLHFLQECITSNSNRLKGAFFYIFANLAQNICKKLFPDIMTLQSLFLKTMNDDTINFYTRGAALPATIKFIQCLSSLNELNQVQGLYPAMMRTLDYALSVGERSVAAQFWLRCYVKLAKNEPRFFRLHIVDVVNTMLEIAENMNLEEKTRHLALEFLLTLVEARKKSPGMMKRVPRFTQDYFALLLKMLLDVKDESSWHSAENCDNLAWATVSYKDGLEFLRRFSIALGGMTVFFIAIEQLDDYLNDQMWEKRHAALFALVHISEGCSKVMVKHLERVVSMVLPSFHDPHHRVRWAAIHSIFLLSKDFSPDLQQHHHNQVVVELAEAMDDFQHPRVQAIAAIAVECYLNETKTLLPYLDAILKKLLVVLQNDNQMVQLHVLTALGRVAHLSMDHFRQYYGLVMPRLKTILINANDKSNHMVRGQALGCISMVGLAVGKEKFKDDVKQVMEVLISSQESPTQEFGSFFHILKTWARIGSCLGKDCFPYMSAVFPFLIKCAQIQLDKTTDVSNDSINEVKFGDEMICAKTSDILRIKSLACVLFGSYAVILEEDFYPWISQVRSTLVPLLKFYIYNDVREKSSYALYILLKSAKMAVEKGTAQDESDSYFKQLCYETILTLGDALYTEPETKVCVHILHSLCCCLEICGPLFIEDQVRSTMDVIMHVIKESSHRKGELTERAKSEDFDAEEDELMKEEREQEDNIFAQVGGVLITLIKTFRAMFLPFLDELSSYLIPGKDRTTSERNTCFVIFNSLVENCRDDALKYHAIYLPFLLDSSNDEDPYVRQCALYGLELCAEHGISIFKPFLGEALSRINGVITYLHGREHESEVAFDNAVSAIVKICQFHRESIDSAQVIPDWLNCLPIKCVKVKAKAVHSQLSSIVERSEKELLGPEHQHFPKILSVFTEVISAGQDLATKETTNRMINVLRDLHKRIPPATWASAMSLLLPQQEMELESILSAEEDEC